MSGLKRALQRISSIRSAANFKGFVSSLVMGACYGVRIPLTHYYSPFPDVRSLKANMERWYREMDFTGIDFGLERQRRLMEELAEYDSEFRDIPAAEKAAAGNFGQGCGKVEAQLLYAFVRRVKPRRFIEVGSGESTYYALQALRKNARAEGIDAQMICIEPYPKKHLLEYARHTGINLRTTQVQDVEPEFFKTLKQGDILFIDSSHVSKIDSDVNYLYLQILPVLEAGVYVHIHDIPFPYLTVSPQHPIFDVFLLWNEAALVKAFLTYNSSFEILLCQSFLHHKHPEIISKSVSIYDRQKHYPTSLWLQRTT